MKNKLLAASLLSMLASSAFAVDSDTDPQTVTVTVPEIALLDVSDAGGTITITSTDTGVPVEAGVGFTVEKTLDVTYALSSNVAADTTQTRKVSASLNAALPENWKLSATMNGTDGTAGTKTEFTSTTAVDLLTGIANQRTESDQTITYTLEPSTAGAMMAYATDREIIVTYTLSGDS